MTSLDSLSFFSISLKIKYTQMALPFYLVATPFFFGLLVLMIRPDRLRRYFVMIGSASQAILAIALAVIAAPELPKRYVVTMPGLDYAILGGELAMAAFIVVVAVVKRRPLPLLLGILQAVLAVAGERWTGGIEAETHFVVDQASLLLVLIVGVVGGLVIVYAGGYMWTYHEEHPAIKDRRRLFSFTMLSFLGAMYGLVLSNDLRLMLIFWEATTLASFILIGYAGDAEADKSAFRALNLNVLGGIGFSVGIILLAARTGKVELDALLSLSYTTDAALVAAPVALFALAGLVKSAQLPFTPWLLGAMVAPTPISALLHSSTMVKAGVFLLIRLAPAMTGTTVGYLVSFIGILTFLAGAFAAVSSRNAKRVLALSTVSNLGLIAACAGIGTYELVWVALFLVLFHAVAKALLFISVGSASVGTGSLDIESMSGLIVGMPRITLFLIVGISCMFVAPFGMLVSKWAAMEAFMNLDSLVSPFMIAALAFGSATTVLFWAKWMGTLVRIPDPKAPRGLLEDKVTNYELNAQVSLMVLAIATCVFYPLVSKFSFEPYLLDTYGMAFGLDRGNMMITVLMVCMTVAVPALLLFISRKRKEGLSSAYMSGRVSGPGLSFKGSKGAELQVATRSYYLEAAFGEKRILGVGIGLGLLLVLITLGTVLI
jgi:ech hydrogenase subunit A